MLDKNLFIFLLELPFIFGYSKFFDYEVFELKAHFDNGTEQIFKMQNLISSQRDVFLIEIT